MKKNNIILMKLLLLIIDINEAVLDDSTPCSSQDGVTSLNCVQCAEGWTKFENSCYQVTTVSNGFDALDSHCGTLHAGAHLGSVHSDDEHYFLRNLLQNEGITGNVWVGLYDIKHGTKPRAWVWTDGSAFDFYKWYGGDNPQPNDSNGNQDCLQMREEFDYEWNDEGCNTKMPGVCKYNLLPCAEGWTKFENSCYKATIVSDRFNTLDTHCDILHTGAHLSSVHSDDEHYFLKYLLQTEGITGNVWAGLYDIKEGTVPREWIWTDGSTFDFQKWYKGDNPQPNDSNGNQDCLQMREEFDYEWNDEGCNTNMSGVCKYNTLQCAEGWTQFEKSCYQVTEVSNRFSVLDSHCGTLHAGAHLSSVHSDEEHYFMKALLNARGITGNVWAGLHDVKQGAVPRQWVWTDGSTFDFQKWYKGDNPQPNDSYGNQDCLQMREEFDFEWNDEECNTYMPGVCKYKL